MGKRKKNVSSKIYPGCPFLFIMTADGNAIITEHSPRNAQAGFEYIAGYWFHNCVIDTVQIRSVFCAYLVSILYKSVAGRYRPVRVADGPITARYRFINNASWVAVYWSRAENIAADWVSSCVFCLAEYMRSVLLCIRAVPNTQLLNQYPTVYSDSGEHIGVRPIFSCVF